MYVIAIHTVSDRTHSGEASSISPRARTYQRWLPTPTGPAAVCVWKSDSVDTVRNLVEGAAGEISENEYYGVNETSAQGLPA